MRIYGVVVLYNPSSDLEKNILSFVNTIEALFIIDNSKPAADNEWRVKLPTGSNVKWQINGQNEGIAKPWNQAATWALKNGADWLLVMDQDSFFEEGELTKMIARIDAGLRSPGVVSPTHRTKNFKRPNTLQNESSVRFVMGSGSLINLKAFQKCGSFDEKLFLDLVDHDYCIRLRKHGYFIWQLNNVFIEHQLGTPIKWGRLHVVSHSATRKYYMSRNRLYVMFKHVLFDPLYFLFEVRNALFDWVKIILIEDDKWRKARSSIRGVWHALTATYGGDSDGPK